jgi:hypothetical protein
VVSVGLVVGGVVVSDGGVVLMLLSVLDDALAGGVPVVSLFVVSVAQAASDSTPAMPAANRLVRMTFIRTSL